MLRNLISCFLLVVIFEGAIRKWILPAYSNEIFALKDIILLFAFLAYAGRRQPAVPRSPDLMVWILWAVMVLGYAALAGFSFESLVGLRYYLAPLPLIVVLPALIRDPEVLDRAAVWAVRLTFPIGILAVIQYLSPLDSPLNAYAWGSEETGSSFGVGDDVLDAPDRPRVSATFSYISTYAAFLSAVWVLAWLSVLHGRSRLDRWLAGLALVFILFNMGMNGSRALLVIAAVTGLPFALTLMRQLGSFRSQLLVAGFFIGITYLGASVFEPFMLTAERGNLPESIERVTGALLVPYVTLSQIAFLGEGIGTTFGGYEQIGYRGVSGFDEVNLDRVGIELGIMGYLFLLALKVLMFVKTWRAYRRAQSDPLRHWALAALLIQLSTVWQIPFYNAVAAIYYFCAIGLVYWIEREEKRLLAASRRTRVRDQRGRPLPVRGWR